MHEGSGAVDAVPRAIEVTYRGENGSGDGLRREFFSQIARDMLDPNYGLFRSEDGGRTLQPNPHSATAQGPDHLSYFALFGRITGIALYHRGERPCIYDNLGQLSANLHLLQAAP